MVHVGGIWSIKFKRISKDITNYGPTFLIKAGCCGIVPKASSTVLRLGKFRASPLARTVHFTLHLGEVAKDSFSASTLPKKKLIIRPEAELTSENVSERCFFRVEKQTLTRLPKTQTILFTILTDQVPVAELEKWQQSNLLGVLRSCPQRTLKYKGISSFCDLLCNDLDKRIK